MSASQPHGTLRSSPRRPPNTPVTPDQKRRAEAAWKQLSRKQRARLTERALATRDEERLRRSRTRRRRSDEGPPPLRTYELRLLLDDLEAEDGSANETGVVVGIWAGGCHVHTASGDVIEARLTSRIAEVQRTALAVGDDVQLQHVEHDTVVVRVMERRSQLSRPDPIQPSLERVAVANIDVVVLVVTAIDPPFRPGLIDRYLVATRRGRTRLLVALNKVDREGPELEAARDRLRDLRDVGIEVFELSAAHGVGVDAIRARLVGTTFALVGQSGVGKSSLANALGDELALRVGATSSAVGKGRHTTTSASLHRLANGTTLIDTPGIRSFALQDLSAVEVREAFPEFAPFAARCRFADCQHRDEPDCEVRAAAERGELPQARLDAYLRLLSDLGGAR